MNERVHAEAVKTAKRHFEEKKGTTKVYWFPAENEVRLVEVDQDVPGAMIHSITPIEYLEDYMEFPLFLAVINPSEDNQSINLPSNWGNWDNAIIYGPKDVGAVRT